MSKKKGIPAENSNNYFKAGWKPTVDFDADPEICIVQQMTYTVEFDTSWQIQIVQCTRDETHSRS